MRLYQIILAVPDDCVPDDMQVMASLPNGTVTLFSEGFISPVLDIEQPDKELEESEKELYEEYNEDSDDNAKE